MKKILSMVFGLSLGLISIFNTSAQILDITKQNDPILRKTCVEVKNFDEQLEILINDMSDTMVKNKGVGIAAPQVGKDLCVFLVQYDGEITEYINPTIDVKKGKQTSIEGCLSVPGIWGKVIRPKYIRGTAFDKYGEKFEFEAEGDEARFICHEYDHLEGKLFTDFATKTFTTKQTIGIAAITIAGAIILGLVCGYLGASYVLALFN